MATCCGQQQDGGEIPDIDTGRDKDGQWWAVVGSSMFTGYDDFNELMRDARRDQKTQRVLPCGHVVRVFARTR